MAQPHGITIWEAQFGDFANNAQSIIDNFIACSHTKWESMSGLVLLLPHGYEGQGAEHSSARLERYLQLCACHNLQVAYPSTPANYFHLLRRQLHRPFRLPLIVMSPKSLLRHAKCVSSTEELESGKFQEVIDDPLVSEKDTEKVLLCAGKIYYELLAERELKQLPSVAIIRLEQLYPLPYSQLDKLQAKYQKARWVWVQEEPRNMGAWSHLQSRWEGKLLLKVTRPEADSTATGYYPQHEKEQKAVIDEAFSI